MSYKIAVRCRLWPYLIAILLLSIIFISLSGGVKLLLSYKKIIQPDLVINTSTLRYFTKEFIQRRIQKLSAKKLPSGDSINSVWLYANEIDIQSLETDLPASSKEQTISGHIKIKTPQFNSKVELRYRGGIGLHWMYEKKSMRIKLPPFTTYLDEQRFDLVNFSKPAVITDLISYSMASDVGLLSPDYFPTRVFLNNNYNGLHFFLSGIDESLLRKNHRMPGSIYSGDTLTIPNPFGYSDSRLHQVMYFMTDKKNNSVPLLWSDSRLWKKEASRSADRKNDRSDIQKFIEITLLSDQLAFMREFNQYFNMKKFYLFWAIDSLTGSHHHDLFHNHKIYFDPYLGKFEPIEWDLRYWNGIFPVKDTIETPLLKQVKLNPVLEYERDKIIYELLQQFSVNYIIKEIDKASHLMRPELEADPYRQAVVSLYILKHDKATTLSIESFDKEIEVLKDGYKYRHSFLTKLYESSNSKFKMTKKNKNALLLSFSVNGNNPVIFSPWDLVEKAKQSEIKIYRLFEGKEILVDYNKRETLYPGNKIVNGNHINSESAVDIFKLGSNKIIPSPLLYNYIIQGDLPENLFNLKKISASHAITGKKITIKSVLSLPDALQTLSIHPWKLSQPIADDIEHITLSGVINISENTVYKSNQVVTISPGTVFKMAKDISIIFYGKVLAEGNKKEPIIFASMYPQENWGSLIVQGKSASGSKFNHIQVSGGSLEKHNLISYPGQFNIHDVDSFTIKNCWIGDNKTGDDALHIAYSSGLISNCHFENTAFDALDIDISDVVIQEINFNNIGNDAIDLMTSTATIEQISVKGAEDKCISVGEESSVKIKNGYFERCYTGIAVKDKSEAFIQDIKFNTFKDSAISLFRKNPRYSKGGVINGHSLYGISENDIKLDAYSMNNIPANALLSAPSASK